MDIWRISKLLRTLFTTVILCSTDQADADPLDIWRQRNDTGLVDSVGNLAFGNGRFVGVNGQTILLSDDGVHWRYRLSAVPASDDVYFLNGMYVTVSSSAAQGAFSIDGETWIVNRLPRSFTSLAFGNGVFVGIYSNAIYSSKDGVDWVEENSGVPNHLFGITFGNGIFVAVGRPSNTGPLLTSAILTSPDGKTWTPRTVRSTKNLLTVAFGDGRFVAGGGGDGDRTGVMATSTNGINWEVRDIPSVGFLSDIEFGSGRFVAMAYDNFKTIVTLNGTDWLLHDLPQRLTDVAFGNGLFVGAGYNASIITSPDGANWNYQNTRRFTDYVGALTFANGKFVSVFSTRAPGPPREYILYDTKFAISDNGMTWQIAPSVPQEPYFTIAGGNGVFVAASDGGYESPRPPALHVSTNGFDWRPAISPVFPSRKIRFVKDFFLSMISNEQFLISSNGFNWRVVDSGLPEAVLPMEEIAYGNGQYVAVGWDGRLFTSPNLRDWTKQNSGTTDRLTGITYGENLFVACAGSSVLTSDDGVFWLRRSLSRGVWTIVYGGGYYVALGFYAPNGLYSKDAIQWNEIPAAWETSHPVIGAPRGGVPIAFGNNSFVIASNGGSLLQSDDILARPKLPPAGVMPYFQGGRIVTVESPFNTVMRVEASANLAEWTSLGTFTNRAGVVEAIDPAPAKTRFYRAVTQ